MNKKIIFRADGNNKIGLGHLFRLFALAEMCKEHFQFIFITKDNSLKEVFPNDYSLVVIPNYIEFQDEMDWISKNYPSSEHILVLDGYQFKSSYQQQIRQQGYFLVYIDDLVEEHMYADVVVNHSASVKATDYKAENYTKFALGTKYAMLRPLFLQQAKQDRVINTLDTAFICFGGSDIYDLSLKAVKACLEIESIKQVNVVLGGAYEHSKIYKIVDERLQIHQNLDEKAMLNLMKSCNFAIAPASTILYELCSVKMPILSGYDVDNQKGIYSAVANNNLVYAMGNIENFNTDDFKNFLLKFFSEINISKAIKQQKEFFDGNTKERFLALLISK